jgi:3-oxoacyl-[acyl-carrier-protein] synthase II
VVTGIGVVSSLGQDPVVFWENILAGKCGIHRIASFDPSPLTTHIGAEVLEFDPTPAFPSPKDARRTDRFAQFAILAGHKALLDSGLDLRAADRTEIGVFIGSGIGGLQTIEQQHQILLNKGPGRLSPFMIPMLILNMGSGLFSMFNE